MITENLSTLKIHKLTQAQYEREVEAGRIDVNALYLTPDEEIDIEVDTTLSQSGKAADAKAVGDRLTTLETSIPSVEGLATEEYVDNAIDNINVIIEETDPTVPAWAKADTKPSYTKAEIGLGNVDNVKQYSTNNPPVLVRSEAPEDKSVIWVDPDDESKEEALEIKESIIAEYGAIYSSFPTEE